MESGEITWNEIHLDVQNARRRKSSAAANRCCPAMIVLDRPLRHEPVRREEVRIVRRYSTVDRKLVDELTMPLGTFCLKIPEGEKYGYYVGAPHLWKSLLQQLASEYEVLHGAALAKRESLVSVFVTDQPELATAIKNKPPQPPCVPRPEIFSPLAFEYECELCGRCFLSHRIYGNGVHLCSNRCESERSKQIRRKHYPKINAARVRKRAEARAGRKCEHCGISITTARSTRRFCSDICRVRAHHRRARSLARANQAAGPLGSC